MGKKKTTAAKTLKEMFADSWDPKFGGKTPESAGVLEKLGHKLYGTDFAKAKAMADAERLVKGGMSEADAFAKVSDLYSSAAKSPFSTEKISLGDISVKGADGKMASEAVSASPFGTTIGTGLKGIAAHPGAAIGTALNTGMGLAGVFDNDKFGGQLIGTAAGAVIPALMGMKLNPLVAYNVAMGAGNIGALFDTLRAKKAQEQANPYGREEYVR